MPIHSIIRFEPLPGKEAEFREELLRVVAGTRTEPGCLSIRAFESIREPWLFGIHSEWVNEEIFDKHAELPHTVHFLKIVKGLVHFPVQSRRFLEIGAISEERGAESGAAGQA